MVYIFYDLIYFSMPCDIVGLCMIRTVGVFVRSFEIPACADNLSA